MTTHWTRITLTLVTKAEDAEQVERELNQALDLIETDVPIFRRYHHAVECPTAIRPGQ